MKLSLLPTSLLFVLWMTPSLAQTVAWINEFHYDDVNGGTSVANGRAFVEVAYSGGEINGFGVISYDGSNGRSYSTVLFSTGYPNAVNAVQFVSFFSRNQKGGTDSAPEPDGFALVDPNGSVVEFLSYEGSFTAINGPAQGLTSVDIGVKETGSTPVGTSLQKCPDVANKWIGPVKSTKDQPNANCVTDSPSKSPSHAPSVSPTEKPSSSPTEKPSSSPTEKPSTSPTENPSSSPTENPSSSPTEKPSTSLTEKPSTSPTETPSTSPTNTPSSTPTEKPSSSPTNIPTGIPSKFPTEIPTTTPSISPSQSPTRDCSIQWNLYNSETNTLVTELTNGAIITNPPPCGRNNIEAFFPCAPQRVVLELWRGSRRVRRRREYRAPYFLFANFGRAIFGGRIAAGRYGIRAIVDGKVSPFTNFTMGGLCW